MLRFLWCHVKILLIFFVVIPAVVFLLFGRIPTIVDFVIQVIICWVTIHSHYKLRTQIRKIYSDYKLPSPDWIENDWLFSPPGRRH